MEIRTEAERAQWLQRRMDKLEYFLNLIAKGASDGLTAQQMSVMAQAALQQSGSDCSK